MRCEKDEVQKFRKNITDLSTVTFIPTLGTPEPCPPRCTLNLIPKPCIRNPLRAFVREGGLEEKHGKPRIPHSTLHTPHPAPYATHPTPHTPHPTPHTLSPQPKPKRNFVIDFLLVRIHLIIEMILLDWHCAMRVRISFSR